MKELCDEPEDHIETESAERRLWCVEFQTLPVICRLNFILPTDAKEAQVREHLRKVKGLEETCVDYEGAILTTIPRIRLPTSNVRSYFLSVLICYNADSDHLFFLTPSPLDQLRMEIRTGQSESVSAASRAAHGMSLNKL